MGPIQPPSLNMPQPISDLRAVEIGDKIVLEFTQPVLTTEGLPLKTIRSIDVRVGPGPVPFSESQWAATAKQFPVAGTAPGAFHPEIPAREWIGKVVVIGVRAIGPKGKPANWAHVVLGIEKPLERPAAVAATDVPQGVQLSWKGSAPKYRIFRSVGSASPDLLKESDRAEFVDDTTQYDTAYKYFIQGIIDDKHWSETSEPYSFTPQDKFAPAVPGALTVEPGVNTIELAWTRNTEPDFKGYNVYRSVEDGPFEKIADLISAPAFSDNKIQSGKKYRYTISAVDLKGNESERSTIREATAQ